MSQPSVSGREEISAVIPNPGTEGSDLVVFRKVSDTCQMALEIFRKDSSPLLHTDMIVPVSDETAHYCAVFETCIRSHAVRQTVSAPRDTDVSWWLCCGTHMESRPLCCLNRSSRLKSRTLHTKNIPLYCVSFYSQLTWCCLCAGLSVYLLEDSKKQRLCIELPVRSAAWR